MAFNDIEISEYFQPQELYTFTRGVFSWRVTSGDEDIDFGGNTYEAIPMTRTKIEATQDLGKASLKINASRRFSFLDQFIATSPTDVITLTITRIHAGDADQAITWKGRVINVKLTESEGIITCQSIQTTLKRPGLRRLYQAACPHVLYGGSCKLISSSFAIPATLTGVSGLTITAAEFSVSIDPTYDPSYFVGGFVEFDQSGLITRRFITDHNNGAGTLTLNLSFAGIASGDSVTAYPGCDHTVDTCAGKFNNINNYGGFPFIPVKNPMNGTPVF